MAKKLYLFVEYYPYDYKEAYISHELSVISEFYDTIYIITKGSGVKSELLSENTKIIRIPDYIDHAKLGKGKLSDILIFFKSIFHPSGRTLYRYNYDLLRYVVSLSKRIREIKKFIRYADTIDNIISETSVIDDEKYFYSYWFYDWVYILSILKNRGIVRQFYSRTHRFDLYDENGWLAPYRNLQFKYCDKVISISDDGYKYLRKRNKKFSNKITKSHLGTRDYGPFCNGRVQDGPLRIVTCSELIPRKRLDLVIHALMNVTIDVEWYHFGGGILKDEITRMAKVLPSNITWKISGHISNEKMMQFYKSNYVDLFINVSESEGIPVSLMEAASFGIPLFATDVGGSSEIVNKQTGFLLPVNFSVEELSKLIRQFPNSRFNTSNFRKGVREYWKNNFWAKKNYTNFYYLTEKLNG